MAGARLPRIEPAPGGARLIRHEDGHLTIELTASTPTAQEIQAALWRELLEALREDEAHARTDEES